MLLLVRGRFHGGSEYFRTYRFSLAIGVLVVVVCFRLWHSEYQCYLGMFIGIVSQINTTSRLQLRNCQTVRKGSRQNWLIAKKWYWIFSHFDCNDCEIFRHILTSFQIHTHINTNIYMGSKCEIWKIVLISCNHWHENVHNNSKYVCICI